SHNAHAPGPAGLSLPRTALLRLPLSHALTTGPCCTGPCCTGPCCTGPCCTGPCCTGPCCTGPCCTGPCCHRRGKAEGWQVKLAWPVGPFSSLASRHSQTLDRPSRARPACAPFFPTALRQFLLSRGRRLR